MAVGVAQESDRICQKPELRVFLQCVGVFLAVQPVQADVARVRSRLPSPQIFATAIVVLS